MVSSGQRSSGSSSLRVSLENESRRKSAIIVASNMDSFKRCILCQFATIWDQILKTFLGQVENSEAGQALLLERITDTDYIKERLLRKKKAAQTKKRRQILAKRNLPNHLRGILAPSSSDEDSSDSSENETPAASSQNGSKNPTPNDATEGSKNDPKKTTPVGNGSEVVVIENGKSESNGKLGSNSNAGEKTEGEKKKRGKLSLEQKLDPSINPGRKMKTEDLRFLAKQVPLLYHMDPAFTMQDRIKVKNAFSEEGMNFQRTENMEDAFLLVLPVETYLLEDADQSSTNSGDAQSPTKIRKVEITETKIKDTQMIAFIGSSSLNSKLGCEIKLFGNNIYLRGEQVKWEAVGDWVGLAQHSVALCYPDGIVESCSQKLILCRNGRKTERPANITKLESGFGPGKGPILQAAEWIARVDTNKRMAFTGAGISAESGVPTYRDPGGLWTYYNPDEVSSIKGFALDPRKVWAFEVEFYKMLRKVTYNPAHKALADLKFDIVTQNVDGLHQLAGSEKVVEVHGSEVRAICLHCKKTTDMADVVDNVIGEKNLPNFRMKNNMEDYIDETAASGKAMDEATASTKTNSKESSAPSTSTMGSADGSSNEKSTSAAVAVTAGGVLAVGTSANISSAESDSDSGSSVASGVFGAVKRRKGPRKKADRGKSGDFERLHSNPDLSEQAKKQLHAYVIKCRKKSKKKSKKNKKVGEGGDADGDADAEKKLDGKKTDADGDSSSSSDGEGSLKSELVRLGLMKPSATSSSSSSSSSNSTTLSQFKIKNGPRIKEIPLCPHCTGQNGEKLKDRRPEFVKSTATDGNVVDGREDQDAMEAKTVKEKEGKVDIVVDTTFPPVGILKPDGIYFGESLERLVLRESIKTAMKAHVVIMVGTTGKVDPARQMPLLARAHNKAKVIEINPNATLLSKCAQLVIREPSALVLPKIQREVERILSEKAS